MSQRMPRLLRALVPLLLLALPPAAAPAAATPARQIASAPQRFAASQSGTSAPASSLAPAPEKPGGPDRTRPQLRLPASAGPARSALPRPDGALAAPPPGPLAPALGQVSFAGLSSQDILGAFGGGVLPPDPTGDVGPSNYVQAANGLVRVSSKAGAALSTFKISALFQSGGLAGICASHDDGDPQVLYDPLADRWVLSQFAATTPSSQCVAVSRGSDPAGQYYLYQFDLPDFFHDYPKLGVWPDAYYMSSNMYDASDAFVGSGAFALDRARMLAGDPSAGFIFFNVTGAIPLGGHLPADLDGLALPPAGAPGLFVSVTDSASPGQDVLRIFEFHPDFDSPQLSTFGERAGSPLPVADFDATLPNGYAGVPQPGTSVGLDPVQDRLMQRLAYRRVGGVETLVVNHTVDVDAGATFQAGVRVYELSAATPGGAFAVKNQASYAPDATNRWMGSAALDGRGNLGVAYSVSSASVSPSLRYTGRLAGDQANTLQSEAILKSGSGSQTSGTGRWGDYSSLTVDPSDECTFWYTGEYYDSVSSGDWKTHVGTFRFSSCSAPAAGALAGAVTSAATGAPVAGATVVAGSYSRVTGSGGLFSMGVVTGTYTLSVSAPGYLPATIGGVAVGQGTTTRNVRLTPAPLIVPSAITLDAEAFQPPNQSPDPSELVTVTLALANTGMVSTSNLLATLLPTGGVTQPSAPRSYGAVPPGAPPVARQFSFRVSGALSCGSAVELTLQLTDGGQDLGTASFTLVGPSRSGGSYTNSGAITILDKSAATPYPSTINVSGVPGVIVGVTVTLNGFQHGFPSDVAALLVAPGGQSVVLMGQVGGNTPVSGASLTFDDAGISPVPSPIVSGVYRPTGSPKFSLPAPAPSGGYGGRLASMAGASPNGAWRLFVADEVVSDSGLIAGGWSLTLKVRSCAPSDVRIVKSAPLGVGVGGEVTYRLTYLNDGGLPADGVVITDTVPISVTGLSFQSWPSLVARQGPRYVWDVGTLQPGAGGVITVTGVLSPSLPIGSRVVNRAEIGSRSPDASVGNNASQAATEVGALRFLPLIAAPEAPAEPPPPRDVPTGRAAGSRAGW